MVFPVDLGPRPAIIVDHQVGVCHILGPAGHQECHINRPYSVSVYRQYRSLSRQTPLNFFLPLPVVVLSVSSLKPSPIVEIVALENESLLSLNDPSPLNSQIFDETVEGGLTGRDVRGQATRFLGRCRSRTAERGDGHGGWGKRKFHQNNFSIYLASNQSGRNWFPRFIPSSRPS